jgi:signal transduction histidine kinase/EAL domain-containing protein (putative c-di-GMP-specific phosphodiesterase class I)
MTSTHDKITYEHRSIVTRFTPIVELQKAAIIGYEINTSTTQTIETHESIDDEIEHYFHLLEKLPDLTSVFLTLNSSSDNHGNMINLLNALTSLYQIPKDYVVITIKLDENLEDTHKLLMMALSYKQAEFKIALTLSMNNPEQWRICTELQPDYLFIHTKLQKLAYLNYHTRKLLENIVVMSLQQHITVIAKDVKTEEELYYLHSIGIGYIQGNFLAPTQDKPTTQLLTDAWFLTLQDKKTKQKNTAQDLSLPLPAINGNEKLENVVNYFLSDDSIMAMAIIDEEDKVLGVAIRQKIMDVFASNFGRSLHAKKKAKHFVDIAIVVNQHLPISEVSALVTKQSSSELQGVFIVTDSSEKYIGMGFFVDLLRAITDQSVNHEFERLLGVIQQQSNNKQRELEILVEHRTSELKEALEHLRLAQEDLVQSEKMAALGQLVAGVAHEVNTPLGLSYTLITHLKEQRDKLEEKLISGILKKNDFQEFLKMAKDTLDVSDNNLQKAAKLIQSFKHVAVDQSYDEKRMMALMSICDEIIVSTQHILKKSQHQVINEIPNNLVLESYPGAISQILSNLIMNANHHAFENRRGGIIVVSAKHQDHRILLTVTDNGKGMSKEIVKKIFDPFFTTKRGSGGSGLGLHIVYNLVHHKLHGKIECISEPDRGTIFNIFIPT